MGLAVALAVRVNTDSAMNRHVPRDHVAKIGRDNNKIGRERSYSKATLKSTAVCYAYGTKALQAVCVQALCYLTTLHPCFD
jgi:hypothetical protein